jgi:CheY-like chemotaxis protein
VDKKILLIDDEEPLRKVMKLILRGVPGAVVYECTDGQEALDLLCDGLIPDVCFCDINMPRVDGFEFVKRIRRDRHLRGLKIVITSANRDKEVIGKIAQLQISGYLLKPYEPPRVRELIAKLLQGSASSAPLSVSRNLLSKTVFVVDPNADDRERIGEFIRQCEDWDVVAVATVEKLFEKMNSLARPDLVVFGVESPDDELVGAINKLRTTAGYASVPVIVSPTSVDRQAVISLGGLKISGMLLKPVHCTDLQAALLKVRP